MTVGDPQNICSALAGAGLNALQSLRLHIHDRHTRDYELEPSVYIATSKSLGLALERMPRLAQLDLTLPEECPMASKDDPVVWTLPALTTLDLHMHRTPHEDNDAPPLILAPALESFYW